MAGLGKRMRPHTWSRPKPLLCVAGKPVLGHVLDSLIPLNPERAIFIIGWLGDQIKEYVSANYRFDARYVVQEELKGQAHAIYLAKEHISGPCIIVFVDTLFEADLSGLDAEPVDAIVYVKEVDDPRRFGVVVEQEGRVTRLIEKPDTFEHRNAIVGLYYINEGRDLIAAIEQLLATDRKTKGEFFLADALQLMIEQGARVVTRQVAVWADCGTPETLLETNRHLLAHGHANEVESFSTVLVPPVHIDPSAVLENAVIGPYVTVGKDAQVSGAVVQNSIIDEGAVVRNIVLTDSLVGPCASIVGTASQVNLGEDASVTFGNVGP